MSHPILTNCDDEILSYELNSSKAYLENLLHHKIEAFSYPNGNFSNREIEAVKKAGYKNGFYNRIYPHTNKSYQPLQNTSHGNEYIWRVL